ncbi:hypothetical protein LTR49_021751 [Elasticomyces elasticus]|nr:hypothetical protein LTR49_021751 [Elasticomyces elasticus]
MSNVWPTAKQGGRAKGYLGRSLTTSRFMFEELRRTPTHPAYFSHPYGPHIPLSAPSPGIQGPSQTESRFPQRVIAPRPSTLVPSGGAEQSSSAEPAPKRRRGRLPKAKTQVREVAAPAASRREAGPAPPLGPSLQSAPQTVGTLVSVAAVLVEEPRRPAPQPPPRMPISAVLTPVAPHTASSSSSSSGRRRRGRSILIDPELVVAEEGWDRQMNYDMEEQ